MATTWKVRRAMRGLYAVTAPGLRFELSRSEDNARSWQLAPRSAAAFKLLGEPDRAPHFPSKAAALAHLRGAVD